MKDVKDIVYKYGLKGVLQRIIQIVENYGTLEPYEILLIEDLEKTLDNYDKRYESE